MNESPQSTSAAPSAGDLTASPNRGVSPTPQPAGGSPFAEIVGDKLQRLAEAIQRLQQEVASQRQTLDELAAGVLERNAEDASTNVVPFLDDPESIDQSSQSASDNLPRGLSL